MNVLISQCLLGCNCRYDGKNNLTPLLPELMERYTLIPVCAEVLGGLPTPRVPSERVGGRVLNREGKDVTAEYKKGAEEVLRLAKLYDCELAILKAKSPSCGYGKIYDGTFTGTLTRGSGVTAELLSANGIEIMVL